MIKPISYTATSVDRAGGRTTEPLGISMLPHLNLARGAGELRLTSADPTVQPYLDYRFLEDSFDRQRLREAVNVCLRLAEHEGFTDIIDERVAPSDKDLESADALDDWLLKNVSTGQHISSTCKMGPASDSMAVVDQYGKVYGVDGLRVADASVMPDCVRANLNANVMMIGEYIAELIRQGH